uniref:Uncharacterized protein n=1 Tax=Cucumis melo TaxID=3656 RepID=A0A9I9EI69_CUCME
MVVVMVHTHSPRSITPTIEGGMSPSPASTCISINRGNYGIEASQKDKDRSHSCKREIKL